MSHSSYIKLGALGLIAGAFLNMIRMAPIYLHQQVGFSDYPPKNLAETVEIAQLSGYYISHIMVFFATPLFLIGFHTLYKELMKLTPSPMLTMSFFGFFIGQTFYTLGVSIHGLILPEMAHQYISSNAADQAAMTPLFGFNHQLATGFGGLGFAFILVSTGVFGWFLRQIYPKLGFIAIILGVVALVGYSTGIFDLMLFRSFMLTAGFVTLMFVFYFVVGIVQLKSVK